MTEMIIVILVVLVFIIIYQVGKTSEYASAMNGIEETNKTTNRVIAALLVIFFICGLYGIWKCNEYLRQARLSTPCLK